jgi:hypothetical protein
MNTPLLKQSGHFNNIAQYLYLLSEAPASHLPELAGVLYFRRIYSAYNRIIKKGDFKMKLFIMNVLLFIEELRQEKLEKEEFYKVEEIYI